MKDLISEMEMWKAKYIVLSQSSDKDLSEYKQAYEKVKAGYDNLQKDALAQRVSSEKEKRNLNE